MYSLDRILLPIDFSERSVRAVHRARLLAERCGSKLTLLHVLTPPQCEFGTADLAGTMLAELCRDRVAQAKNEIEGFEAQDLAGMEVERVVLEGDPATLTVDYAHREHTGLIVMATHGYGPFRRFILGSNTAKVLHDADCPVWTGTHMDSPCPPVMHPIDKIMCAVDLGPQSSKALCWAASLAADFGAELTLLHVTPCDPNLRPKAGEELDRLRNFVGAQADIAVETGEPPRQICAAAERMGADVVVIGRGSAAGVFGRLRANAYTIIRESPCPVVSV